MNARILGFISNRPDLGARVLCSYGQQLDVRVEADQPVGWGVGFYQGGELLLRRRPIDERATIPVSTLAEDVESDVLIGHVGRPAVGELRTENTQPLRYRQWLFAQLGKLEGFSELRKPLSEGQPDFLTRSRRGDTDAELFFFALLSALHQNEQVHSPVVSAAHLRSALRQSALQASELATRVGAAASNFDVLLTNGELIGVLHRSSTLAQRVVTGRREVESFLGDGLGAGARTASTEKARCTLVAGPLPELPEGWQRLPSPSVISLARTEESVVEAL